MTDALESELGVKAILENDANAAAIGENRLGASKDCSDSIMVTLGTGVGGGITSVWTGLKYPETFARIGGQSSSFWVDNQRVIKELEKLDANKTPFRFYFDAGTLEGVENSRRVNVMMRGKGFPVVYEETETGHNWTSWRDRLADAFIALWK